MHSAIRSSWTLTLLASAALIGSFFAFAPFSSAHDDPASCSSNGVGLSLTVFRADGTTPVGGGSIAAGETVKYQATLTNLGGTNCNYEGGTLNIITPDGVTHTVASPATPVVPLVTTGSPFVSTQISYVATGADAAGDNDFDAAADYSGGISHTGEIHDTASAHVDVAKLFTKASPSVSTQQSAGGDVGVTLNDTASVTGGSNPTGSVTFRLYPPSDASCTGAASYTDTDVSAPYATSPGFVSNAAGVWHWTAVYNGDVNNNPATSTCASEPVTVTSPQGRIIIIKQTTPDATSTQFEFDPSWSTTNFMLADGQSSTTGSTTPGTYSVGEINLPAHWTLASSSCSDGSDVGNISLQAGETVTCTFNNTYTPPPPPAGEYCSPGYWKQSQHFDSWVGYSPTDSFSSVFGESVTIMWSAKGKPAAVTNPTLLQVLEANGGGVSSLARAAVGALLNASAINSSLTEAQVKQIFQDANPSGNFEAAKAQYTFPENCPLN